MEVRVKQASSSHHLQKLSYFSELKEELKKVSWTSKDELMLCTKIVVGAIFLLGIGIYVIDLIIKSSLQFIGFVGHLIGG